jgi:hypothetical protein
MTSWSSVKYYEEEHRSYGNTYIKYVEAHMEIAELGFGCML